MKHTQPTLLKTVGAMIFASRWLQAPLYLGLIIVQGVYVINSSLSYCISLQRFHA